MSSVKLDTSNYNYEDLEEYYRGFIAPAYKILVSNEDIVKKGIAVDSVTVDTSTSHTADKASFTITNAYNLTSRALLWKDSTNRNSTDLSGTDSLIKLGDPVEIHTGYTDRLKAMFFGYITNIEYNFSSGQAPSIEITAMDISFFMMRSGQPHIWSNVRLAHVVQDIRLQYPFTDIVISRDPVRHAEIAKNVESDHEFLQELANKYNYRYFVLGKKLYFTKESASNIPVLKLEWGKQLMSVRIEHDIADQVAKVVVKANIRNTDSVITVEGKLIEKIGLNSVTGPDIMKKLGNYTEVHQITVDDEADALEKADSIMEEHAKKLVSGSASCIGMPEIQAGRYIEIGGLGKGLDTKYYINSTTHTIDSSGYQTTFNLEGNAV